MPRVRGRVRVRVSVIVRGRVRVSVSVTHRVRVRVRVRVPHMKEGLPEAALAESEISSSGALVGLIPDRRRGRGGPREG